MRIIQSCVTALVILLFGSQMAFAQVQQQPQQQPQQPEIVSPDEISDEELIMFAEASDEIQPIQHEAQDEFQKIVEEEGMEFDRFQQILMAMQNPQLADQMEISADEEEAIQVMQPKLMEVHMEAENKMIATIEESGIEIDRFQAISMSLQQYPELLERLQELVGIE